MTDHEIKDKLNLFKKMVDEFCNEFREIFEEEESENDAPGMVVAWAFLTCYRDLDGVETVGITTPDNTSRILLQGMLYEALDANGS